MQMRALKYKINQFVIWGLVYTWIQLMSHQLKLSNLCKDLIQIAKGFLG